MNKPQVKMLIGFLLLFSFLGTFFTGKFMDINHSLFRELHDYFSTAAILLVCLHVIGQWPMIRHWLKSIR